MNTTHHRVVMPSRRITDPKFKYVCAAATDIRRTFRKARLFYHLAGKRATPTT